MSEISSKMRDNLRFYAGTVLNGPRREDVDTFNKAEKLMKELIDLTNGGNQDAVYYGMLSGLIRSHRYLQGASLLQIIKMIGRFGSLPEREFTDPRNKFSHELAGVVYKSLKDKLFWSDKNE